MNFEHQYFKPGPQLLRFTHFETRRATSAPSSTPSDSTPLGNIYRVRAINTRAKEIYFLYRVPNGFKPHSLINDLAKLARPPKPWCAVTLKEQNGMYVITSIAEPKQTQQEIELIAQRETRLIQ